MTYLSRIDNESDPIDCDRGLCDVRGEDALATPKRGDVEHFVLFIHRQGTEIQNVLSLSMQDRTRFDFSRTVGTSKSCPKPGVLWFKIIPIPVQQKDNPPFGQLSISLERLCDSLDFCHSIQENQHISTLIRRSFLVDFLDKFSQKQNKTLCSPNNE